MKCTSVALLIPCLVLACEHRSSQAEKAGELRVQWDGSADGSVTAPASATWCEGRRLLEIRSIHGDTGIALALYPGRRITAGSYRILEPTRAESVPPAAAVAMRWLTRNVVQGFRGDSGQLRLERSRFGELSGQVHARARSVVDTQRITLKASFHALTPRPDSVGCSPINRTDEDLAPDDSAEAGDTMVN